MATNTPPPPGPQQPTKYPYVGPNYRASGEQEQNGYVYDYTRDKYVRPQYREEDQAYREAQGLVPKKPKQPGIGQSLGVGAGGIAVGYGAIEAGRAIGRYGAEAAGLGETVKPVADVSQGFLGGATQATNPTLSALNAGNAASSALPGVQVVGPGLSPGIADGARSVGMLGEVAGAPGTAAANTAGGAIPTPNVVGVNAVQPTQGFDYGSGLMGGLQAINAYNELQKGNNLGAGLYGAGAAANIGTSVGSATASAAASNINPILGLYGAYNTAKTIGDNPYGGARNVSATLQGAGAGYALGGPIGAGIGATIGLVGSLTGSSKDKFQMIRDKVRKALVEKGVYTRNEKGSELGTLADGSTFDFGKDGKKFGKPQSDNPLYGQAATFGDIVATADGLTGKGREAMATLYANAAVSNAGSDGNIVRANAQHFLAQRGITNDMLQQRLKQLKDEKKITDDQYNVWSLTSNQLLSGAPATPSAPGTPGFRTKPLEMSRSTTSSPGIGKDGKRIKV